MVNYYGVQSNSGMYSQPLKSILQLSQADGGKNPIHSVISGKHSSSSSSSESGRAPFLWRTIGLDSDYSVPDSGLDEDEENEITALYIFILFFLF